MKRNILLSILCFLTTTVFAQVEIDKSVHLTGTFPDNRILGAGALGIGTTTPAQKIDVVGGDINVDGSSGYRINNTATSGQYLRGNGTRFISSAIQAGDLPSGNNSYIQNQAAGDQSANFQIAGNGVIKGTLGIGTALPQEKLNVIGNIAIGNTTEQLGVSAYTIKVLSGSSFINSGNGRDLIVEAGISDNTAGKRGGHLYLRAGQPQAPATTFGNVVLTDNGGNTGIGTSSPAAKLHVVGTDSDVAGNQHFRVSNNFGFRVDAATGQNLILESNNSGTWSAGISLNRATNRVGIGTVGAADKLHVQGGNIRIVNGTAGIDLFNDAVSHRGYLRWTGAGIALYNRDNSPIFFGTTDAERMRIDAGGNVSIGGHTPNTRLDLGGTANNKPVLRFSQGSNTNVNYVGYAHNDVLMGSYIANGYPQSYLSFGYMQDPNRVFHLGGASDANFNASTSFVSVFSVSAGASADVNNGNELRFHTSTNNNARGFIQAVEGGVNGGANYSAGAGLVISTSGGESIAFKQSGTSGPMIMTLTSAGRCGIGTNPNGQLELSLNEGRKPLSSVWTVTSDARLKNIDGTYEKGLAEILKLNPILYHYKNVGERRFEEEVLNTQAIGFSAQEVQKVFPECVKEDEDGYLSLDVHAILVAYVNAFKEQQSQIEQLKTENTELKAQVGKINDLDKRLSEMDQLKTELESLRSYLQQEAKK